MFGPGVSEFVVAVSADEADRLHAVGNKAIATTNMGMIDPEYFFTFFWFGQMIKIARKPLGSKRSTALPVYIGTSPTTGQLKTKDVVSFQPKIKKRANQI
jgi:hypothetical protein